MSEHTELVAGLREYPVCGCNGCWNALQLAADAIEAVETKVERLENHKDVLATALQQSEEARIAAMRERDEALETSLVHLARAEEAEKHEAIAVADNAALLEELVRLDAWDDYGPDHPGAAVLARVARLEALAEAAQRLRQRFSRDGDELMYLPDEDAELFRVYDDALDAVESEAK